MASVWSGIFNKARQRRFIKTSGKCVLFVFNVTIELLYVKISVSISAVSQLTLHVPTGGFHDPGWGSGAPAISYCPSHMAPNSCGPSCSNWFRLCVAGPQQPGTLEWAPHPGWLQGGTPVRLAWVGLLDLPFALEAVWVLFELLGSFRQPDPSTTIRWQFVELVKEVLLLLHIKRSRLRWFGHLVRMPSRHLPGEVLWACPSRWRPQDTLVFPRRNWRRWTG